MIKIFTNLPLAKRHITPVILVVLVAIITHSFHQPLIDLLVYHRNLITQGEYWRIISGHFLHTNTNHLLLNMAGAILLWSLHGQYYNSRNYISLIIFSSVFVSTCLYIFSPELIQYVGLSGILHGVFIWGALQDIRYKIKGGYLLLIGVTIKVIHEQIYGASEGINQVINANVAIDAHLWGGISGLVFFGLTSFYIHKKT